MSQKTDEIKNELLKEIGEYDPKKYRKEIADLAEEHGVVYTVFEGQAVNDKSDDKRLLAGNQFGSSAGKSKMWIWITLLAVVALSGAGFFAYKKGYLNKMLKLK